MDKSPLLANGYHAPPHFNPLQYMAHHMAGLGYPPLLPGGIPAGMPGGGPHVPPHPISPNEASPLKHPHITPETLARMHEERVDRERQMALDQRRGLTPTSMAGPLPPAPLPISTHDDHQPPTSPVLNLSRGAPSECKQEERGLGGGLGGGGGGGGGGGEEEREHDLASHDSGRDLHEEERRHSTHDEDRFSDMDDDEDKDESMDVVDSWTRASSTIGQTQLTSPPAPPGALAGMGGNAPLSSTEVLLRNILGLLRVAEENARHHERQSQCEKAELKMEVLRERELRETLEKQLQEEQKNRILMQKRCAKLKKLRRRLQERLDVEMKRRSRYEDHIRSNSPDALGDINGEYPCGLTTRDTTVESHEAMTMSSAYLSQHVLKQVISCHTDTIRKEMEAIAKELQSEDMQQAQKQMEEREAVDRLLAPPALANHPAITAATANAAAAWR
ncbi:hypothetical protein Pcinc_039614 [Petrolisthes cinctipes]|nr:hypothetical protein Pcinc_039614 [Petrolisthes cinctipes]